MENTKNGRSPEIDFTCIAVGRPFPGPVPQQDGVTLEMGPEGDLVLLIQMRKIRVGELAAIEAGFDRYSFFQTSQVPTLAVLVFKFPSPVGYLETFHHTGLYHDDRVSKFLKSNGNALLIYVLDGDIVKLIRRSGLQPEAMSAFREAVVRQKTETVTPMIYASAVNRLQRMSPKEIFHAGKQFRHRVKAECKGVGVSVRNNKENIGNTLVQTFAWTPMKKVVLALNHYISTSNFIGVGSVVPVGDDLKFIVTVNRHNPTDVGDFDKLTAKLQEISYPSFIFECCGRIDTDFDGYLLTIAEKDCDAFIESLTETPGPMGWGSTKRFVDLFLLRCIDTVSNSLSQGGQITTSATINFQEIILKSFSDIPHMLLKERAYHSKLPTELENWYCYTLDGGHSILGIVVAHSETAFAHNNDPCDYLMPISVKTVIGNYYNINGFIVVDVEYDEFLGPLEKDDDFEF
jgi:hypothetical protein